MVRKNWSGRVCGVVWCAGWGEMMYEVPACWLSSWTESVLWRTVSGASTLGLRDYEG